MRNSITLCLLLAVLCTHAQKADAPQRYAAGITPDALKNRLLIVASREMEGRETGTEGQHKAAAYIENEFRAIGLTPGANGSYQMPYAVYQDLPVLATLAVGDRPFELGKDFTYYSDNISASMAFSKVAAFSATATDSIRNADLAGRLVLLATDPDSRINPIRTGLYETLRSKGAAAVMFVSRFRIRAGRDRRMIQSLTRTRDVVNPQLYYISEDVARAVAGPAYDSLRQGSIAAKTISTDVYLDLQKKRADTLRASNVLGVLEGSDLKDQILFITAHFDHLGKRGDSVIYYGADDDGSGTVSVIELAKAFAAAKKAGHGPRRTIVFMTVSGEEKGLWGSAYYNNYPLFAPEKVTADLNIDMIGRTDSSRRDTTNYVYVVGDDKLSTELKPLSERINKQYTQLELDYKFNDPADKEQIYFRSDHYNFAKSGIPIIFYYDGMLGADYHKPTDTPDKINYALMAKRAQLVFYTAWEMANRPKPIRRDLALPEQPR